MELTRSVLSDILVKWCRLNYYFLTSLLVSMHEKQCTCNRQICLLQYVEVTMLEFSSFAECTRHLRDFHTLHYAITCKELNIREIEV